MSDPNMLLHHLPESYIDAVKTYQSRKKDRTEENPVAKALFRWVLPESEFVSESNDDDDVSHKSCSEASKTRKDTNVEGVKSHRRVNIILTDETLDALCKEPQTGDQSDDDTASVDTENTAEIDSDDDWQEEDDDWCDTYSESSGEDEPLVGEGLYDSWLSRSTFLSPGDYYFSPTVDDFPRGPTQPNEPVKEAEIQVSSSQKAASSDEEKFDFWAGFRSNLKKVQTFADDAIQDIRRKAEEAQRKREEERRKMEQARRNEEEALRKAEEQRKRIEARRKADDIIRKNEEIRRQKMRRRNSFANSASRSLPQPSNERSIKRTSSRSRHSSRSQENGQRSSQSRVTQGKMKQVSSDSLGTLSSVNGQSRVDMQKPSLTRSNTSDNLAQFFADSKKKLAQRASGRQQNTSASSHRRQESTAKEKVDKFMNATKDMYHKKKRSSKSKEGERRPTHRRSRSQRLVPSAMNQNDFPWY